MKTQEPSIPFDPFDYNSISVEALPSPRPETSNALHLACSRYSYGSGSARHDRWVGEGTRRLATGAGVLGIHFMFLEDEDAARCGSESFLEWLTHTSDGVLWNSCSEDAARSHAIVEAIYRRITATPFHSPQPIPRYLVTPFESHDDFWAEVARIAAAT